jgi:hypothetical protein
MTAWQETQGASRLRRRLLLPVEQLDSHGDVVYHDAFLLHLVE